MSINDITNIHHCFIKEEFLNDKLVGYTLTSKDGYEMRIKPRFEEESVEEELWFDTLSIPSSCDFSKVEIRAEVDLLANADNCSN